MLDRIKLAEAMGWELTSRAWRGPNQPLFHDPDGIPRTFDPFTDANDDEAILAIVFNEWPLGMQQAFDMAQRDMWMERRTMAGITANGILDVSFYRKTGDNARAALKVIE